MTLIKPGLLYKEKYIQYIAEWAGESITPVNSDLKDKTYDVT